MVEPIVLRAGAAARRHIAENGLSPGHVRAVIGASGAAKWLGICGLDQAIFGEWLPRSGAQPIDLLGTSIGTFKLAAACRNDPVEGMQQLADAYIGQAYSGKPTPESISAETARIVACALPDRGVQVLQHSRYRFHAGTVRCHGALAATDPGKQKRAVALGFGLNLFGRSRLRRLLDRVVFSDPRSSWQLDPSDGIPSHSVMLDGDNIMRAIEASGALPVYMQGVTSIPGAPDGVYRDGGLIDYHPIPQLMFGAEARPGVVLYPHFFGHHIPGWFDKTLPWRVASASELDQVLTIAPSPAFVASLPGGKLPDRKDFLTCTNAERQRNWRVALEESERLGAAFLELADDTERLLSRITPH